MRYTRALVLLSLAFLGAGAVCSALDWSRAAGAAACLGLGAGILALALTGRAALRAVDRVAARVEATDKSVRTRAERQAGRDKKTREQLRTLLTDVKRTSSSATLAATEARAASADVRKATGDVTLTQLRTALEETPHATVELHRLYDALVRTSTPLPALGGWAATTPTILALVDEVRRRAAEGPVNVVECGSGASTVWVAHALAEAGHGHVYALEHEPAFAEQTRAFLQRLGLDAYASVIDAPLVETTSGDRTSAWYELAPGVLPDSIDVLFVDGPPGTTAELARIHAFPQLAARLGAGSWVVLDDTHRPEERRIARSWQNVPTSGRVLRRSAVRGRSTVFEVVELDD